MSDTTAVIEKEDVVSNDPVLKEIADLKDMKNEEVTMLHNKVAALLQSWRDVLRKYQENQE